MTSTRNDLPVYPKNIKLCVNDRTDVQELSNICQKKLA